MGSKKKSDKSEKLAKTSKSIAKEILKAQAKLFTCVLEPSVLGKMMEYRTTLSHLEACCTELALDGFLVAREVQAKLDAHIRRMETLKMITYGKNNIAPLKLRDSTYQAYDVMYVFFFFFFNLSERRLSLLTLHLSSDNLSSRRLVSIGD